MFCKNCGEENLDSANFCKSCGGSIGVANQNAYTNNYETTLGGNQKSPWDFYLACFRKYATFTGRAQRAEYWYFALFNSIIYLILFFISSAYLIQILCIVFYLAMMIPGLAVAVRRLHDVGKGGWMILISLIPLIGSIWLLILMVTDSNPGNNQYGPNPKGMLVS